MPHPPYSADPTGTEIFIACPDGTRLRTRFAGTGQAVLLAHGYGGGMKDWNVVFDSLLQLGFRVIAFDQRGHGDSTIGTAGIGSQAMAADYEVVMNYFELENAVFAGHSMGGFLGIVFMLNFPETVKKRLKSALLLSSFAGNISENNPLTRFQIPVVQSGLISLAFKNRMLRQWLGRFSVGDIPEPTQIEASTMHFSKQNHLALVPILKALSNENYTSRLFEIHLPVTVMTGLSDRTIPPFHSVKLAKGISQADLVQVPGIGHLFYWENPEKIVEEILKLAAG